MGEPDDSPALRPCPFCGAGGEHVVFPLWDVFDDGHIACIHCSRCGARGPSEFSDAGASIAVEAAQAAWNRRDGR